MSQEVERFDRHGVRERRSEHSIGAILTRSLYVPIVIGIMLLGGTFGFLGVILVYLGAKGSTDLKLFGQSLHTADVGVASIFIGATIVVLVIRRVLRAAETLTAKSGSGEPPSPPA